MLQLILNIDLERYINIDNNEKYVCWNLVLNNFCGKKMNFDFSLHFHKYLNKKIFHRVWLDACIRWKIEEVSTNYDQNISKILLNLKEFFYWLSTWQQETFWHLSVLKCCWSMQIKEMLIIFTKHSLFFW